MYWGDYLKKTARFTLAHHGAYMLLIAEYWTTGKAIPADPAEQALIVRIPEKEWAKLRPKIAEKFNHIGDLWVHERVEIELAKAAANYAARARAGAEGAAKRWQNNSNATAQAKANGHQNDAPLPSPSQSPNGDSPKAPKGAVRPEGFDAWYETYPHKVQVGQAVRTWAKLAKAGALPSLEVLTEATKRYIATKPADIAYRNPATWLYGMGWNDVPAGSTPESPGNSNPTEPPPDLTGWRLAAWREIGAAAYKSWFENAVESKDDDGDLVLTVPRKFNADWIRDHYIAQLQRWMGKSCVSVDSADSLAIPAFLTPGPEGENARAAFLKRTA